MSRPGSKALSRQHLKEVEGWPVVMNAEQFYGGRSHDFLGIIDLVAIRPRASRGFDVIGVQALWRSEFEAHMEKVHGNAALDSSWLAQGLPLYFHLWPDAGDWEDGDRDVEVVRVGGFQGDPGQGIIVPLTRRGE